MGVKETILGEPWDSAGCGSHGGTAGEEDICMEDMEDMSPSEVGDLLRANGYEVYAETFERHEVKGSHLARLSAADLEKMGVDIVGHQLDLLKFFSFESGRRR